MTSIPTSQKRPFIPAPGVIQAEMVYSQYGHVEENVYHALIGDGSAEPTTAQMDAFATTLQGWETDIGQAARNMSVQLELIRTRQLGVQNGIVRELTMTPPIQGDLTGATVPSNVTVAVKWGTAFGGRSFRGRTYHIGLEQAQTISDGLVGSARTGLVAMYQDLLAAINSEPSRHFVVVSYSHNKFWRPIAVSTPITQVSIEGTLDSQRRRLTGRGA